MNQRKTEWLEKADMDYNERQFEFPYRSTVSFFDWLDSAKLTGMVAVFEMNVNCAKIGLESICLIKDCDAHSIFEKQCGGIKKCSFRR